MIQCLIYSSLCDIPGEYLYSLEQILKAYSPGLTWLKKKEERERNDYHKVHYLLYLDVNSDTVVGISGLSIKKIFKRESIPFSLKNPLKKYYIAYNHLPGLGLQGDLINPIYEQQCLTKKTEIEEHLFKEDNILYYCHSMANRPYIRKHNNFEDYLRTLPSRVSRKVRHWLIEIKRDPKYTLYHFNNLAQAEAKLLELKFFSCINTLQDYAKTNFEYYKCFFIRDNKSLLGPIVLASNREGPAYGEIISPIELQREEKSTQQQLLYFYLLREFYKLNFVKRLYFIGNVRPKSFSSGNYQFQIETPTINLANIPENIIKHQKLINEGRIWHPSSIQI